MKIIIKQSRSDLKLVIGLVLIFATSVLLFCFYGNNLADSTENDKEVIIFGKWTEDQLDNIIRQSSEIRDVSGRIDFLSKQFLNTDYKESTLIGDINTPEVFVMNLEAMDCFTYIDYVEAMRLSSSFHQVEENLKRIRYQSGKVSFLARNHFFTDWSVFNKGHVREVTEDIGGENTKTVDKVLNKKEDGTYFLPGIPTKRREIKYIPSNAIDDEIIARLKTGDYVGIYSDIQGLDVSHTGIIIKEGDKILLRHASSREENRKVLDEDFKNYIANKQGIIVFRPK